MSNSVNYDAQLYSDEQREVSRRKRVPTNNNWLSYLPMLLRGIGALAVVVSLYTFLARGWDSSSDLVRYLFLLGHTFLLAAIGLGNAKLIKEAKGARLLLILALVSVPINFAILGAFIFAGSNGIVSLDYPTYLTWSVDSLQIALYLTIASMALLIPTTLLGYKVLTRSLFRQSSCLFVVSNCLLLIPFRQAELVAVISLLAAGVLFAFHKLVLTKDLSHKTLEGKIAFGIQFLPIIILLGRSFWLYSLDAILISSAALVGFVAIRQITLVMCEKSKSRVVLELLSLGLVLVCALNFGVALDELDFKGPLVVMAVTIVSTLMTFELSLRGQRRAAKYRILSTLMLVFGLIVNFLLFSSPLAAFICLAVGALLMVVSFVLQQKSLFIGALILVGTGLYFQFAHLMHLFEFNYWIALATLGIASIVSGSYLEANATQIKMWIKNSKSRIAQWEY